MLQKFGFWQFFLLGRCGVKTLVLSLNLVLGQSEIEEDFMKALSIITITVISPLLSLPVQAETMHSGDGFVTTSGNIQCAQSDPVQSESPVRVFCIRSKPGLLTAYIENGHVKVTDQDIFSIDVEDQPTLHDGESNIYANTTCSSAKDGVTCTDHGTSFKISRRGVETLTQAASP
jgi:hypothetical protein